MVLSPLIKITYDMEKNTIPRVSELVDLREDPKSLAFYQGFLDNFTRACEQGSFHFIFSLTFTN